MRLKHGDELLLTGVHDLDVAVETDEHHCSEARCHGGGRHKRSRPAYVLSKYPAASQMVPNQARTGGSSATLVCDTCGLCVCTGNVFYRRVFGTVWKEKRLHQKVVGTAETYLSYMMAKGVNKTICKAYRHVLMAMLAMSLFTTEPSTYPPQIVRITSMFPTTAQNGTMMRNSMSTTRSERSSSLVNGVILAEFCQMILQQRFCLKCIWKEQCPFALLCGLRTIKVFCSLSICLITSTIFLMTVLLVCSGGFLRVHLFSICVGCPDVFEQGFSLQKSKPDQFLVRGETVMLDLRSLQTRSTLRFKSCL